MFCDKLSDGGHELAGDLHDGLVLLFERGLVFAHGLFRCLMFVVRQDGSNSLFVPPGRESRFAPTCLRRMRLL